MKELISTIGAKIREARLRNKLTIKYVAEHANLTKSFISQLENGKITPSLKSLLAITGALNITLGSFFNSETISNEPVVRSGERKAISTKSGVRILLLTPDLNDRLVEFLFVIYEKEATSGIMHSHRGQECGIVLKGKLEVRANRQTYVLNAGDSISLNSDVPHQMTNISKGTTEAIWVNCPPTL